MKIHRSYSISLSKEQKESIDNLLARRQSATVWSDDVIYSHIEELLLDAFLLGIDENE